jgi:DNA-binding response OmpR family regulator
MASILVVDDDKAVQEMLKDLLTRQGYEVHTCRDGKEVMPELARHRYDLLILDVLIPHMNGFVLMEQIRADASLKELPVIMISGIYRSRNHRADMTTRYNVIDYLDKPLSTGRLLDLVGRVVASDNAAEKVEKKGPAREHATSDRHEPVEPAKIKRTTSAELDLALAELLPETSKQRAPAPPVPLEKPKTAPVPLVRAKSKPPPLEPKAKAPVSGVKTKPTAEEPKRLIVPAKVEKVSDKLIDTSTKDERKEVEAVARHAFKKSAFVLQGSIGKIPVPAILGRLWRERASGGLLLRREQIKKIVFLKKGNPFAIKSNLVGECLGQILLRERLINKTQCEQSIEIMKETSERQGEILVQMGALTPKNLSFALELQLETKLFETFTWSSGEYRFNDDLDLPPADNELSWTGPTVVIDGIRRTFDEKRLAEELEPVYDDELEYGDESVDAVAQAFSEKEQQAIANLGLPRTTHELVGKIGLTTVDAMRLIYILLSLEIVRPVE